MYNDEFNNNDMYRFTNREVPRDDYAPAPRQENTYTAPVKKQGFFRRTWVKVTALVLACDWLFFYYMPGYSGAWNRFLWFVLPSAVLSIPVSLPIYWAARKISIEFKIDNGVV